MIETIKLFRKKNDDIWALFILEFYKFIGCLVTDCIVKDDEQYDKSSEDCYDASIILNLPNLQIDKENIVFVSTEGMSINSIMGKGTKKLDKFLKQIIMIWTENDERDEIYKLEQIYCESELFYYLYNKGNIKFVREYYPSALNVGEQNKYKERAYVNSVNSFEKCFNKLKMMKEKTIIKTVYFEYAFLDVMYKLNEIEKILGKSFVFCTETLIKQFKTLYYKKNNFIRSYYLMGEICEADVRYLWRAEKYFCVALELLSEKNVEKVLESFIYYRFGRYFEKFRKNIERAYLYYEEALKCDPCSYRARYKIAKHRERLGEFNETILMANDIIWLLLNGYSMQELMPKQQIYVYKSFVLLGDTYKQQERYGAATQCYENAKKISCTISRFYLLFSEEAFKKIAELCMPIQPIYYKMIGCAFQYGDMETVKKCYDALEVLKN